MPTNGGARINPFANGPARILIPLLFALVSQPAAAESSQPVVKLVGTGAEGPALQGLSVALSADGDTAIVGGYADNNLKGAAWIYTRNGETWTQQGSKLVGTGGIGFNNQGFSVALSADGNTAIVGGHGEDNYAGATWVFARDQRVWTQQGDKLRGIGAVRGRLQQGISVALSADGNTAIVGGHGIDRSAGAAWIYTRNGGAWTQQGDKLVGSGAIGWAQQGWSVALSADGNTALVGGYSDDEGHGAGWIYTRNGERWTQQAKLVGSGAAGAANQGYSVALSADGNTAILGGYGDDNFAGASWVFTRSGDAWTQQGDKLVGAGAVGPARQGQSVALSADGNTVVVGGFADNNLAGATWVFTRNDGVWTQSGRKLVLAGAIGKARQGRAVGISASGDTIIIGGFGDNQNAGAAWVVSRRK